MSKIVSLFFGAVFLSAVVWLAVVPLWHFPDEQAHFGQIAFMAERGYSPKGNEEADLTEEIYVSELLLGTARDRFGNNNFTFHPEFRIEYTNILTGKYEASIAALTKSDSKKAFVRSEASRYPVLYYWPGAILYKLLYHSDLFSRVFAVRGWSLLLYCLNILVIFNTGKLLLRKKPDYIIYTSLAAFAPMMVFASVGVNSDSLGNLVFSIYIYLVTALFLRGLKLKYIIASLSVGILSVYVKPQFIISLPLLVSAFALIFLRDSQKKHKLFYLFIPASLGLAVLLLTVYLRLGPFSLITAFWERMNISSLWKFSWEYTLPHTYREVLPWYWGVYDWLGVTYPRLVYRMINLTILLSGVGLIRYLFTILNKLMFRKRKIQAVFFLLLIAGCFFAGISFFDWYSWYTQGFQLGVQGRYFFPVSGILNLLLFIGIRELAGSNNKAREWSVKILGTLMIMLNVFALYTVAKTYYAVDTFQSFIIQSSQYKPAWFKYPFNVVVFCFYLLILVLFLYRLFTINDKESR